MSEEIKVEDQIAINKKEIMTAIAKMVKKERLKQRELATLFDIQQPRVSDLLGGKAERFSLDILLVYLQKLGYTVQFKNVDSQRGKPIRVSVSKVSTDFDSVL